MESQYTHLVEAYPLLQGGIEGGRVSSVSSDRGDEVLLPLRRVFPIKLLSITLIKIEL